MFSLKRYWQKLSGKLWLRPTLSSAFAIFMAAFAYWFGQNFDSILDFNISEDTLLMLLGIFTSSMLSVATFTVSAIVTAASSASNSTTPRASQYVLNDGVAQFVLSTFIAAFIYSIVGIFSLKVLHYGSAGRFVLFLGLIFIVVLVLIALINWIDHAIRLGRQSTIVNKLTEATVASIDPAVIGTFGAQRWQGDVPANSVALYPQQFGYVTDLDMPRLQKQAERTNTQLIINTRPGEIVEITSPIAYITPAEHADENLEQAIQEAIATDTRRQPLRDIRHNLLNLTETADRALSPGINDPGTAIHIMNIQMSLLIQWARVYYQQDCYEVHYDRLSLPTLSAADLVSDCFNPIARDGAGIVEVGIRLQKVLQALTRLGSPELTAAAKAMSSTALELAEHSLVAAEHRAKVAKIANEVAQAS
ncbi:DUF2254 domain-containing protein [Thiolinea disciformis]|uniref:DUF2254 domain-containing protein n=1 Tax=Thiolinea disciformis TaxID=125614 RepID=UPI000366AD60|nr:DUF2254 domain-containing protein [Thiolinea disciformis]